MNFTAEPAPRSSLDGDGGYFRINARPGKEAEQAIVLRNLSQRPLELRIAAADAATGAYGGVSYGLPGDARARVGKWISFEQPTVRLAAGEAKRLPFTVAVPAGAVGGEHLGGITISVPSSAKTQETERGAGQAGASLNIQTRRVIAVVVRVPGPAEPRLVVTGVTPAARADGVYLEIGIENRGGALTKAKGTITLPDDGFTQRFALDTFVPGTATAYPLKWAQSPRDGEHRATVELSYGTRKALWTGTFTIGEEVKEALVERGAPGKIEESRNSALTLAAVAAAAAVTTGLLGGIIWLFSRRRRKRADRHLTPSGERDDHREQNPPSTSRGLTEDKPAAAIAGSGEPAVATRAALPPQREETLPHPPRPPRPSGEPNHAPLAAATAVAVGSALWVLLRRRDSGGRF
ncbi:MAG: WxL protein peptidoglycan domain-containing protein [Gaiellaceae bacterium]